MYNVFTIMYNKLFLKKGLSLERLHSFCLVASAGGFNKAAGENIYKQSQYSKQIADLEKFFGCRLFVREGRKIRLTDAGQHLLDLSKSFFSQAELFVDAAFGTKIDLAISTGCSVIDFLIPRLLTKEVFAHTRVVTLKERASEDAIRDVLSYDSTLAIATNSATINKDIRSFKILSSKTIMIYMKSGDRFYIGNDLKRLAENPTAMLTGAGRYKKGTEKIFNKSRLNTLIEAPSFSSLKAYVFSGTAVAYVPEYCITDADRQTLGIHTFPRLTSIRRDLYLICRKNIWESNKSLQEIVGLIEENAKKLQ